MKAVDIIFALICGRVVAWVAADFMKGYGMDIGPYKWFLYYVVPVFSLFCLWIAYLIGKKLLFVYQAAKFLLVGAFAAVIDIKIFQLLAWASASLLIVSPLLLKGTSFLIATSTKYWGNKHWVFGKNEKDGFKKELIQFLIVTLIGVALDVCSFYYFTRILGPQFSAPPKVWQELSIILAACVAAVWNFSGYKFIVFKR